jgi:hypothetical protein
MERSMWAKISTMIARFFCIAVAGFSPVIARHEASLPLRKQGKQSQIGQKEKKHSVIGRQEFLKADC